MLRIEGREVTKTMRVYLVQHGQAAPKDVDPDRPLTEAGRRDVEKVSAFLKPLAPRARAIVHSGKTRAAETAEILGSAFEAAGRPLSRESLGPNDPVEPLKQELEGAEEGLVIVGHLPFLAKLASVLLAGSESPDVVAFRQGGVICIERGEDDIWRVLWMVSPEILV